MRKLRAFSEEMNTHPAVVLLIIGVILLLFTIGLLLCAAVVLGLFKLCLFLVG